MRRRNRLAALLMLMGLLASMGWSQGSAEDYRRSSKLRKRFASKIDAFQPGLRWLAGDAGVWWEEKDAEGDPRFVRVDTATGARRSAATKAALGLPEGESGLPPQSRGPRSKNGGVRTSITFLNRFERKVRIFWVDQRGRSRAYGELDPGARKSISTYAGHAWILDFEANDLAGSFVAESFPGLAIIDERSREAAMRKRSRPRRAGDFRVRVRNHQVIGIQRGEEFALTTDGTADDFYRRPTAWSPNGRFVLGMRVRKGQHRKIALIESAPDDQVQPKLIEFRYDKPGDRLDVPRPYLFDLEKRRAIAVDPKAFEDARSIARIHWAEDSKRVFVVYRRRGHQAVDVVAIDAPSGTPEAILEERAKHFIDDTQKLYLHWLEDGGEFLWASERDGWNHLYRFDAKGQLRNQVTKGDFVVREVERVDESAGQVWFTALGLHAGQDPYHRHLARVDLDGRNLTPITQSDGSHTWKFSPSGRYLITRWSRVDHPWVTELRRARDGKLIAELGRDDDGPLRAAGYAHPQRFTAKGRDGKTDIWGYILRPSRMEPQTKYPVIEHIYAGPHGHHVPKTFKLMLKDRELAELGFIVVRIDGMGTNWRHKAFHDLCWQNLKDAGLPDRIAWMRAAGAQHPELDLRRVGIFGGSAGGQNALSALLHHGDFYSAAAADCGCHDNRMDKVWWNEAWMGLMGPHYADNSNVTHAAKLRGKLLLTVGELDRNVDPASTLQVVDALLRAGKDFEFILVPGAGHGVGERPHLVRRRQDFFVRSLWKREPRH